MSDSEYKLPIPRLEYRGKKVHNYEWCYGLLVELPGPDRIHAVLQCEEPRIRYQVMPSSLGIYTGRKDKTGKEIYSNDAIKLDGEKSASWKVRWNDAGYWALVPIDLRENQSHVLVSFCDLELEKRATIMGNLNDNPELFKTSDE